MPSNRAVSYSKPLTEMRMYSMRLIYETPVLTVGGFREL
jgi:hypothetical protein